MRTGQSREVTTGLLFVHQHLPSESIRSCQSVPSVQLTKCLGGTGIILCNTDPYMNALLANGVDYFLQQSVAFLMANRALGVFYFFVYITAPDFPLFILFLFYWN